MTYLKLSYSPFLPGQPLFTLGSFYHLRSMLHLAPELRAEKLWLQSPGCLPPPQRGAGMRGWDWEPEIHQAPCSLALGIKTEEASQSASGFKELWT